MVSHPFYDLRLLIAFVDKLSQYNKKILYITYDETYVKRQFSKFSTNFSDAVLFSTPFVSLDFESRNIDLVIFDDVSGISFINDSDISLFLDGIKCKKKIILSIKEILETDRVYVINENFGFFREPRSIQTKIDLNFDIPHVVFEFLEWFMINKTKVILVTKDILSSKNIYSYIKKYVSLSNKLNNLFVDFEFNSFHDFEVSLKLNSYIYITSDYNLKEFQKFICENDCSIDNFNIVVFFASDKVFDYKTLLRFCAISNFLNDCKNEVIFVSNYENMEIITTKDIARSYNKKLWEFGLRKY